MIPNVAKNILRRMHRLAFLAGVNYSLRRSTTEVKIDQFDAESEAWSNHIKIFNKDRTK
jgi:hypothetical protein